MTVHVFSGPTVSAARVWEVLPHAVTHPPVRHGDLMQTAAAPGDVVLIIDGAWHQSAPVRHKEILFLLAEGVRVVGAASMGALRAAELAPYGMTGVGAVFEDLAAGRLDADDEVAVLHTPDGHPLSEALVNIRAAVTGCANAGQINEADARTLETMARALPYTRRSWAALARQALEEGAAEAFARVEEWRRTHPYDVKRQDAENALAMVAAGLPAAPVADVAQWAGEPWRTSHVRYWEASFRPGPSGVPFLAILQYQQLYDPGFPARWRARVLAAVAGPHAGISDVAEAEGAALRAAAAAGVTTAAMTRQQLAYWLTPEEIRRLHPDEALIQIMVRSARLDGAWSVWPSTREEAGPLIDAALPTTRAVIDAFAVNAAAVAADARRSTAHLAPDRIALHLGGRWNLPLEAGHQVRDAAARDRAFRDFAGAVEVARAYYLGERAAAVVTSSPSATGSAGVRDSART